MTKIVERARNLRRNPTEAEKKLWHRLRNGQIEGFKFRRQHPVPPYVVDFFCEEAGLIVEADGGQHTPEADAARSAFLQAKGYKILRFWNNDILQNIEGVLSTIREHLPPHPSRLRRDTLSPGEREVAGASPFTSPSGRGRKAEGFSGEGQPRILLGKIATAHGVRGLVKVTLYGDDPQSLEAGPMYADETATTGLRLTLKGSAGKHWLAEVEGVRDRDAAEALRGTDLWIDRDDLPAPAEDEYFHADLVGLEVRGQDGAATGKVVAVQDFGAGTLLEVRPAQGGETFYIPFHDDFVTALDVAGGFLVSTMPEGIGNDG